MPRATGATRVGTRGISSGHRFPPRERGAPESEEIARGAEDVVFSGQARLFARYSRWLLDRACVIALNGWHPPSVRDATGEPTVGRYFQVAMDDCGSVVCRMVRCAPAVALPSGACAPMSGGGAFGLREDQSRTSSSVIEDLRAARSHPWVVCYSHSVRPLTRTQISHRRHS